jgi:O-antigen/teichoic acid export membrane protein
MNPLKKLASETVIYGIPTIVSRFLNWLLVPFYTIVFANNEYGAVVNLMAYNAIFMVILTYGMETGFFRFAAKEKKATVFSTVQSSLITTSVLFVGLVYLFLDNIHAFLDIAANKDFIMIMAITISIDAISSIPFAKLRLDGKAIKFGLLRSLNILINIVCNLSFLLLFPYLEKTYGIDIPFYDFSYGIGYIFISYLIASFSTFILLLPEFFKEKYDFSFDLYKRIMKYSFPILIVGLAGMVNINLDKILLPKLLASDEAMALTGIYGANYKLALVMFIFVQAFRFAFEPFFFAKHKGEESKNIYVGVLNLFTASGLLIFLAIMFYIDKLIFLIDPSYHSGVIILPWVLMANLFQGIYYSLSLWYKLSDNTKYGAYMAIFGSIITIALNWILIPRIGFMGGAYAVFICFLVMTITSYFLGQKYFKINYNIKRIALYFASALAIYVVSKFIILDNIWLQMALKTPLLFVFIMLVLYKERLLMFKR